jgi:hypothetical protein
MRILESNWVRVQMRWIILLNLLHPSCRPRPLSLTEIITRGRKIIGLQVLLQGQLHFFICKWSSYGTANIRKGLQGLLWGLLYLTCFYLIIELSSPINYWIQIFSRKTVGRIESPILWSVHFSVRSTFSNKGTLFSCSVRNREPLVWICYGSVAPWSIRR